MTIGETGGDAVTMSLFHADKDANNGGYLIGTCLFMALFIAAVVIQITMKRFQPSIYWLTIVATTTVGTAMADFADRSLGIGYLGGSSLLFALLMASLLLWRWSEGTVSVNSVATPRAEVFYWITILFSQTLGNRARGFRWRTRMTSATGTPLSCSERSSYSLAAVYYFTDVSRVFSGSGQRSSSLRLLGATLGDLLPGQGYLPRRDLEFSCTR